MKTKKIIALAKNPEREVEQENSGGKGEASETAEEETK